MAKKKVVLAYSGGLDTSVMIKWIQEQYDADVVSCILDVGQGKKLKEVEEKAWKLGVVNHYSIDAKKEFVDEYCFQALKANALYMDTYPVSSSLSRPLISKYLVEVAGKEDAWAAAHGCTGKGNDQVRFDITIKAHNPDLKIIAPVREWNMGREEEILWAKEHGVPVPVTVNSPYSIDQNLWGRSIESGILEYPEEMAPDDIWEWTAHIKDTPDEPEYITIGFQAGVPVSLNGEEMDSVKLVETVKDAAGRHGIGRVEHMEDRIVGLKSRETYEVPAAEVLIEAHKDLEKMVLTRHQKLFKMKVDQEWSFLTYAGLWVDPLMDDLNAYIDKSQENVTGEVKMKLYNGKASPVARSSKYSLYDINLTSFDINTEYNQKDAVGFINLWGLPSVTAWALKRKAQG